MKTTKIKTTAALLMLFAALGSCVKGDKGDMGQAGTNGTNGLNGSANVNWATGTTNSSSWTWSNTSSEDGASWTWLNITQGVVDSGTVLAYMSNGNGGWSALPFTYYGTGTGAVSLTYSFVYYLNGITVWVANSNNINVASSLNGSVSVFKFLTILPAQRRSHPNTNWNNYNEAVAAISSEPVATN